jgi:hypothetical protein
VNPSSFSSDDCRAPEWVTDAHPNTTAARFGEWSAASFVGNRMWYIANSAGLKSDNDPRNGMLATVVGTALLA